MAKKPHKDAGLAMEATTKLDDATVAALATDAATAARTNFGLRTAWASVRVDAAKPGRLSLSVRGPGGHTVMLAFVLEATPYRDGQTALRTRIASYSTRQETLFYLIPAGPKKMNGLQNYRRFIDEFGQRLRAADPSAAFIPDVRIRSGI
ncbi:MAG: hypothetical protein ACM3ML_07695 [Micromonosporaceae bacterium]